MTFSLGENFETDLQTGYTISRIVSTYSFSTTKLRYQITPPNIPFPGAGGPTGTPESCRVGLKNKKNPTRGI
jgi:hypothetical protein